MESVDRPSSGILFRSLEWEVRKTSRGRWDFRPRPHLLLGLTLLCGLLGFGLLSVAPNSLHHLGGGGELLFRFLARLLQLASVLTLLACLANQRRKVSLHPASGVIVKGRELLQDGYQVEIRDTHLGDRTVVSMWAVTTEGRKILLVPGQNEDKRERLLTLQTQLQPWDKEQTSRFEQESFPLKALICLLFGALWSIGGYLWAPYLVWAISETHGVLVWPFGLVVMTFGVLELMGISILDAAKEKRVETLLGVGLMGVYAWICWTAIS